MLCGRLTGGLTEIFCLCGALDQAGFDPVKGPCALHIFTSGVREVQSSTWKDP